MGHQRLDGIPHTRKWRAVVDEVVGGAGLAHEDVDKVAALTLAAAETALENGKSDPGLRHTFFLLTQIVLAARQPDWEDRLAGAGLPLAPDASLFDLTSSLQSAIDDHTARYARPTDISEMAQQAAGEALAGLAGERTGALFGGHDGLRDAVRELSTKAGFSRLGQVFFGRFMARFLNFYLSRVTASAVGTARLPNSVALTNFNRALQTHCEQSARIVRDFCGQWYSKTEYVEGIDPQNTARFMAVALDKLRRELAKQRAEV